eukprot:TRINITY_DN1839_c0_g1_i1.p1 TRINITY_DN1839_c0_g1~~TRINITY_DN1839_c0_g1_i1.p1  ORF type:complete len:266 (+),score=44.07 TRINITY_DN1839_c0_g1_i1:103-900(+)
MASADPSEALPSLNWETARVMAAEDGAEATGNAAWPGATAVEEIADVMLELCREETYDDFDAPLWYPSWQQEVMAAPLAVLPPAIAAHSMVTCMQATGVEQPHFGLPSATGAPTVPTNWPGSEHLVVRSAEGLHATPYGRSCTEEAFDAASWKDELSSAGGSDESVLSEADFFSEESTDFSQFDGEDDGRGGDYAALLGFEETESEDEHFVNVVVWRGGNITTEKTPSHLLPQPVFTEEFLDMHTRLPPELAARPFCVPCAPMSL